MPNNQSAIEETKIYRWVKASERLPDKDGLYIIEHRMQNQSGNRHEMFFKTEDKKWYWQPNPYSVCGDGFIVSWLEEIPQSKEGSPGEERREQAQWSHRDWMDFVCWYSGMNKDSVEQGIHQYKFRDI
jgi:hypothetical protein